MLKIVVTDCSPPPDPGVLHAAKFEGIDGLDGSITSDDKPLVRLNFSFVSDKLSDWDAQCLTETTMNRRTKLGRLIGGMLGRPLQCNEALDELLQGLVGREFRIRIRHRLNEGGEVEYLNVTHAEPPLENQKSGQQTLKSKTKA